MKRSFLEAKWQNLIMMNYVVDPKILEAYLPLKTELDLWDGLCYVSLVGFMFTDTKVKGIKIPFHVNFEEVNLRFYVRYNDNDEWKRGVVFIKEIVPRPALSFVANTIYGEHYETLPMTHKWDRSSDTFSVEYKWKKDNIWNSIAIVTNNELSEIDKGSEEEFITEHYWGYTKLKNNKTSEYGVEHPRWKVYNNINYNVNVDFEKNYGGDFAFLKNETPKSVFLADGSDIVVKEGKKI